MEFNVIINKILADARKRARKKGISFSLTGEYLKKLWDEQNGCCSISGISLVYGLGSIKDRNPYSPSIDRINNKCGYTKDNIRLVCYAVNMGIFTWGLEVYDDFCKARVKHIEEKELEEENNKLWPETSIITRFNLPQDFFRYRRKNKLEIPNPDMITHKGKFKYYELYKFRDGWLFANSSYGEWITPWTRKKEMKLLNNELINDLIYRMNRPINQKILRKMNNWTNKINVLDIFNEYINELFQHKIRG